MLLTDQFDIVTSEFQEVTCLKFHPKEAILASGSRDCSVKIFDYSKASAKKAMRTITDAEQISDIAFHPTGKYYCRNSLCIVFGTCIRKAGCFF